MPNARKSNIAKSKEETKEFFGKLEKFEKVLDDNPETVAVMLMKSMILKMVGKVTGKEYIFNGGGSIVNVDIRDMDDLLEHNQSIPSCCGSYSSPNFEVLGR